MIYIFGGKNPLLLQLRDHCKAQKIRCELVAEKALQTIEQIYTAKDKAIHAVIASDTMNDMQSDMWIDMLEALTKRLPVLVLTGDPSENLPRIKASTILTWLENPSHDAVLHFLATSGALEAKKDSEYQPNSIPIYNPQLGIRLLEANGFLSMISIHASDFDKVALEYGGDVYQKLQHVLVKILFKLWGHSGAFRKSDILCRRHPNSNTFYILLERSRSESYMPIPGDLERLAERLTNKLENLMWQELNSASKERILPSFLEIVPRFVVSYGTALYNPCVDSNSITQQLLRSCRDNAEIQDARMLSRQKELIQTLIQADNLLTTHFQGVFDLRKVTTNQIKQLKDGNSLDIISHSIYAFEALARVQKKELQKLVGKEMSLNVDYLNPGVLFSRAKEVNLKLELDQACFRLSMETFFNLPGKLMVNILPRNFYFLTELIPLIPDGIEVVFEVSETEAINNMSLIQTIREKIAKRSHGIAIDDFGKGYAGVDRIIKIRPTLIKLDQVLITEIDKDPRMQAFIKGLIEAARSTQSLVLAEGVETHAELETLAEMGVDLVQGFYLHRPQSHKDIAEAIKRARSVTVATNSRKRGSGSLAS